MQVLELYDGTKTYMFPSCKLATPEVMKENYPAILEFAHAIETDENGEVCFGIHNVSVLRTRYGIDKSMSNEEAIIAIQEIMNTPPIEVEDEPSAEERIAAALEYQVMSTLPDEEETTEEV